MLLLFLSCSQSEKILYPDDIYIEIDADGDGYPSLTSGGTDCDDTNANIFPNQIELCDGIDNNCNNEIDEGVQIEFFMDVDEDGFGSGDTIFSCEQPPNTVNNNSDCDDQNASVYPFANEICDGIDNNCDTEVDENLLITAYIDNDQDGFGDPLSTNSVCQFDENYVSNNTDCNDNEEDISPIAVEQCDGIDNNCNNEVDEFVTIQYFADQDEDGFGDPIATQNACSTPLGFVDNNEDCNDTDELIHPLSNEYCDEIDNDCDGFIDIFNVVDGNTYFIDADADGFGSSHTTILACTEGSGYVSNEDDCDDQNTDTNPLSNEYCDDIDNNCNGFIDEDSAVDALFFYIDNDGDGFGLQQTSSCVQLSTYSYIAGDCDDSNMTVNPSAVEYCDGIDNNCNDIVDEESAVDTYTLYLDNDGDGYGNTISYQSCTNDGGTLLTGDCDDEDIQIHPNAVEYCDDIDNNCNNILDDNPVDGILMYADMDNDTYGNPFSPQYFCEDVNDEISGYVDNFLDCNDNDATFFSDNIYYLDDDNDGFGGTAIPHCVYNQWLLEDVDLDAYKSVGGDCDDNDIDIHPNALEFCSGSDVNCDGITPQSCGNCKEILEHHPDVESGVYGIFEPIIGSEDVYCDMETDGGGWTLVQRTLWDWTETQILMTDYESWYYDSQNSPFSNEVWRLEGQFWNHILVEGEHMFRHVPRNILGNDCESLYYIENNISMNISSDGSEIINTSSNFILGNTFQATDQTSTCVETEIAVPFFYDECCVTCPSYQGTFWSDSPHPMASYLDDTADLYGNTISEVCNGNAAVTSDHFEGINIMEYYLR